MKKLAITLAVLTSIASYQAKAIETVAVTNIVTYAGITMGFATVVGLTSAGESCKVLSCKEEASQIVEDSHEYFATGEMSEFIAQKVEAIQGVEDMSDDEAVDLLIKIAEDILK